MPYTLKVEQYNLGDQEIFIHGLGSFSNGEHEISDEQADNFRVVNSVDTGGFDQDPDSPTHGSYIPKHELGPDLVTASQSMHGVTVTKVEEKKTKAYSKDSGSQLGDVDSAVGGAPAEEGGK